MNRCELFDSIKNRFRLCQHLTSRNEMHCEFSTVTSVERAEACSVGINSHTAANLTTTSEIGVIPPIKGELSC